ncbi:MAG: histidinol-phosphatase [Stackebrandtia sp.]
MFDLHTHHDRCGHARGGLRDYVEAALRAGLDTLGFSDHSPFFAEPVDHVKPWVAMAVGEFPSYVEEAIRLREEYRGRIRLLVGVESDYIPQHAQLYADRYKKFPLDYVIGSVHLLDGVDVFQRSRWETADEAQLRDAKERYCDLVARAARSGMFDILGHVDVIKANCPRMERVDTPASDRMLRAVADADVVMEINTSGKTKDCGGWYPSPELIERACRYGVKVTFGSDAHVPERVGDEHDAVRRRLKEIGFREWYVFEQRKRIRRPL